MSTRRTYLWAALAFSALAIVLALVGAPAWIRAWFGLPVATIIPGYGLLRVMDPRGRLGVSAQLVVGVGASLAAVVVTGLLLETAGVALGAGSWAAGLGGLCLAITAIAIIRCKPETLAAAGLALPARLPFSAVVGAACILGISAAAALGLGAAVARQVVSTEDAVTAGQSAVTQLWALPGGLNGTGDGVVIGVSNTTLAAGSYDIRVTHGPFTLAEDRTFLLPGESTTLTVQPATNASVMFPVEAQLSGPGDSLRHVAVWVGEETTP